MCRQRKVNTDIVLLDKRGLSLHKHRPFVRRCLFIRWLARRFAHLAAGPRGRLATEGTVSGARSPTTLGAVLPNVGGQIFFQPSTVSTELTFLTRLIVFKKDFPFKDKHIYTGLVAVFN